MTSRPHPDVPQAPLRPPGEVMRLARMGAFFPTRLSFMRSLIRRLHDEGAEVTRPVWEINAEGYGRAVYSVPLGGHVYSLVAFSTPLAPENRTDRVIAEAWDTSYALFDGQPTAADLDRLQENAPRQEAGRYLASELVLCRANKSVRLFDHVVERLASGRQPDAEMIGRIGYLMRTTAVYGNGKFGIADRARIAGRPALAAPFRAEMLTVWLIRGFTLDLVEHIARARDSEQAVALAPRLRRHLGIGNATGLGMAPFLVSHPVLVNNWMLARETALARVRAVERASAGQTGRFLEMLARARRHIAEWSVDDARQSGRIETLRRDLGELEALATPDWLAAPRPWDRLIAASARWSVECQEMVVALVLEPYGRLVDDLAEGMASDREAQLEPGMTAAALGSLIEAHFGWATAIDFSARDATRQFWYASEEKLEPRLGDRYAEPGAELEMPLDIARQVQALAAALAEARPDETVAELVMREPGLRHVARRVQTAAYCPYSEIRDNLIGAECLPIDILRCKLAFFGASKFDPKSDRWTRITMYQGAPSFGEIGDADADDWAFPVLGDAP
jgi:hypothetical protein